ncbi:hypothetical protein FHG87_017975 [Trinorchestia longiramus]|nr:hypothetical protein FHG87_017975 [Trinorchestia longiramus]
MAYVNLVWVLLLVQWTPSSLQNAQEESPNLPAKNFWNSYDEAVSRFGGLGLYPSRSDSLTRLQDEHNQANFMKKLNMKPPESEIEIRENSFQSSSGKVSIVRSAHPRKNSTRHEENFSVINAVSEVSDNQTDTENNIVNEGSRQSAYTDLTRLEEPVTASSGNFSVAAIEHEADSMLGFSTITTTLDFETKPTEFLTGGFRAAEYTSSGGNPSYNRDADDGDLTVNDQFSLEKSFLSNITSAANGTSATEGVSISMAYPPNSQNISSVTKIQSGDPLAQSGEIVNAIISTVLSLRDNSSEDFENLHSNFIPYKYAQDSSFSDEHPEANALGFYKLKSGPLMTSFVQLYKDSISEDGRNVSDQVGPPPAKFHAFTLADKINSAENSTLIHLLDSNRTATFDRNFTLDVNSSSNNISFNLSQHLNNTGYNFSLHPNKIRVLNDSLALNSTKETLTTTSLITLPPVRNAPTPVKRVVSRNPPAAVASVVVNRPPSAPEEPNIQYDQSTSQYDSLVRVVQHPSLLTAGFLNMVNTVGFFGSIIALPFMLPLAVGGRRRRSLDDRYTGMSRDFITDSR